MLTSLNLLCLRASDPKRLVDFYEKLGLSFRKEKHGSGPVHHACELGGSVFEIYPLANGQSPTASTRIGFCVPSIDDAIKHFDAGSELLSAPKDTQYGRKVILRDPEGHKVELVEISKGGTVVTPTSAAALAKQACYPRYGES